MGFKGDGPATDWRTIDDFDGGFGWIAYPEERLQRASHALVVDDEVWVIDPVDADGIDEAIAERGTVAGVVVLFDQHTRDAVALARRHDVPVHVPHPLEGLAADIDAPVARFRHDLADTHYAAHPVVDRYVWHEAALYSDETGVLVVPEALGTAPRFRVGDERLGVHPALRFRPPTSLARLAPDRVLLGHGEGVHDDPVGAIEDAVTGARRRLPKLYWQNLKALAPV